MPTREQLESALKNAHQAGDEVAAKSLANALKSGNYSQPEQPKPTSKTNDSYGLNLAREGLQGMTFGFSDELGAGMAALAASMTSDAKFTDAYADIIKNIRGEQNAFREENPISAAGAQLVGGIATGGAGLAKAAGALAPAGASMAKTALVGAGAGAVEGGIAGAGFADENKLEGAAQGAKLGAAVGAVGGAIGAHFAKKSALKDEVAALLKSDKGNIKTAKYIADGANKIKKDRVAVEAIRQGYDEGIVATIKGSSKADKAKMRQMLDILKRGKENTHFGATNAPSQIAGDSMAQRVRFIQAVNKKAGQAVRTTSRQLKGQDVDFRPAVDELLGDLDELGIKFNEATGQINFKGSDFEALEGAEKAIRNVLDRMRSGGSPDAYDVHRLKKYIDNNVEYGRSAGGAVGDAERVIKKLRTNMDAVLDGKFKDYDQANTVFSNTKEALDKFNSLSSMIDMDSANVDKTLGNISRRIMSHAVSKGGVLDVIQQIDDVAATHGAKFSDDIVTQALFADELNKVFGATARTSLQGEGQKVARTAAQAASGNIVDMGLGAAGKAYDSVRGVNQDQQIKIMQALLNR